MLITSTCVRCALTNNAVVEALESHAAMADKALKHTIVFKGLANVLVGEAYLRLRAKSGGLSAGMRHE